MIKYKPHEPQKTGGNPNPTPLLGKRVRKPAPDMGRASKLQENSTLQANPTIVLATRSLTPQNKSQLIGKDFGTYPSKEKKEKRKEKH